MTERNPTMAETVEASTVTSQAVNTAEVRLDGQIVVVTGATGSAGRAMCTMLQNHGAQVIATSRSIEALELLQAELSEPLFDRYVVDLSDSRAVASMFKDISTRHHGLNAVIHLVGGWRSGGVERYDETNLRWLFDQLVVTTANVTAEARVLLQASRGRFVNVSSPAARNVTARNAAYASTKAAADTWAASLAHALTDTCGTVTTFEVKALYDDAAVAESPDQPRDGHTHVNDLARAVLNLWTAPAVTARVSLP